jgi:ubiquinone/menaquinone biosynthesis C-methylase UbiE
MRTRLAGANHESFEPLLSSAGCGDAQFVLDKILRANAESKRQQREQNESHQPDSSSRCGTPLRDVRSVSCYKIQAGFRWQHDADDSKASFRRKLAATKTQGDLLGLPRAGFLELFWAFHGNIADAFEQIQLRDAVLLPLSKHTIGQFLYYAVVAAFAIYALQQVRKPGKWIGRFFLWIMNISHSSLTDWGLQHVQIKENFTILDVGCGGGRTIQKIAALATKGKVYGVDYADGSVAASRARNAQLIQAGRVEIKQGSVSQLPFPDNQFDLVTAVETQYYWPDLVKDMQEIRRVVKPSGTLLVIAESYKKGAYNAIQQPVMKLLKSSNLGLDDHRQLFSAAGYTDVQVFEERTRGWFCGTGKKPV